MLETGLLTSKLLKIQRIEFANGVNTRVRKCKVALTLETLTFSGWSPNGEEVQWIVCCPGSDDVNRSSSG
jgi:hypothetical protein